MTTCSSWLTRSAGQYRAPSASVIAALFSLGACLLPAWELRPALAQDPTAWKAGVATTLITPDEPMWMAGYASRTAPSDGKVTELFAKALAIEDDRGTKLVVVTTDLIGIPRALRDWLVKESAEKHQLAAESLLLNASHTHCGPELRANKIAELEIPEDQVSRCEQYFADLQEKLLDVVGRALADLRPAKLSYTHGRAGFAMNRRLPTKDGYQNRPFPDGPVDHDVPVLRIDEPGSEAINFAKESQPPRAILFGYACHNTTLGIQQFCGDYAGFAQQYLEETYPGSVALFFMGCGGDQNPQPRSTVELARQHGRALANGVQAGLISIPREVRGPLRLAITEAELRFADPPSRKELEGLVQSRDRYDQRRGRALLAQLDKTGQIDLRYAYPIHVARFGDDLTVVALAGEVVVDYALRLKTEFRDTPLWVAGYSNDVFGYVPSRRVLLEGGYEAGDAMRYSTFPGPFEPTIEDRIMATTHQLLELVR